MASFGLVLAHWPAIRLLPGWPGQESSTVISHTAQEAN
jgi:hypothetical protein